MPHWRQFEAKSGRHAHLAYDLLLDAADFAMHAPKQPQPAASLFDRDWTGRRLGDRYHLALEIAGGAQGFVYRAWDEVARRNVAVKILRWGTPEETPFVLERFIRESRVLCELSHPHIVRVLDAGQTQTGEPWFVMEYLTGRSLADVIADEGPLDPARALSIIEQMALGVRAAHQKSILHRDIKPQNVIVFGRGKEERIKLFDFGLAKAFGRRSETQKQLTHVGSVLGSPQYMSPEQIIGTGDVGPGVDIYSLGATLFQMLAGTSAFRGSSHLAVLSQHLHKSVPAIASINPSSSVPAFVEAIVARCMRKRPEQRYGSAGELVAAIRRARSRLLLEPGAARARSAEPRFGAPAPANDDASRVATLIDEPIPLTTIRRPSIGRSARSCP